MVLNQTSKNFPHGHERADLAMGTRVGFVRRFGVGASGMPDKVWLGRDLLCD